MSSQSSYRPDIDGLRSIAILAVVFYHADIKAFSGGFIGVDVFFVISGYLITGIISTEILAGKFSLIRFYERRIRRIFPALFTVLAATLIAGFLLFDSAQFMEVSKSAAATSFFGSNLLFWSQAGYFDDPSTTKPLLHTWSLGVEEQFYIFFPMIVLILERYLKSQIKIGVILLALTSFAVGLLVLKTDPESAFYFMHLRAWELLTGSLLALGIMPKLGTKISMEVLSGAGLIMIVAGVLTYTEDTLFPGLSALLPVLGSALIIYTGGEKPTITGKFLSLPPLVFIGKISYSLYLWHWPVIIFGKFIVIRQPSPIDMAVCVFISFLLATISWKFVENPFRTPGFISRKMLFILAGSLMATSLAVNFIIESNNGFPVRFNQNFTISSETTDPEWIKWRKCGIKPKDDLAHLNLCKIGNPGERAVFLVWGDSHAQVLSPGVNASSSRHNTAGYLFYSSGCPPLLGIDRAGEDSCILINNAVVEFLKVHDQIKTVILTARWSISADGQRYKTEKGHAAQLIDIQAPTQSVETNAQVFNTGLSRTVATLLNMDRDVVIVAPIPEIGFHVPSATFMAAHTWQNVNDIIAPTMREYQERNKAALATITALEKGYSISIIDPAQILCSTGICLVAIDQNPLYYDNNHLSTFGSLYITHIFDGLFQDISASHRP